MWAGPSGERWLANAAKFEQSLRPIGDALLEQAALARGHHVIEIGCGAGSMTLDVAGRVAPGGSVTAVDISPALIAEASRRAAEQPPRAPIQFLVADAARVDLPSAQADVLLSRFGVMFFADPHAAFTHLHSLLRPTGRLAFACWASPQQNPWMLEARATVAAHFDVPMPAPRAPGPFAFEEAPYLRDILTTARFHAVEILAWQSPLFVGGPGSTPQAAAEFLLNSMSIIQRIAQAPAPLQKQIRDELTARLQPFMTPEGVRMPASAWLVTAHA
jgi:SAM-dependent methyltransferase